jgi:hypothetical protein
MLGILVLFCDFDHILYTSPVISAEYGDLIYITLVTEIDVVILEAVKTEANMPISIST